MNRISSLVKNIKPSAGIRDAAPTAIAIGRVYQYQKFQDILGHRNITLFYLPEFCLLYREMRCVAINNNKYLPYLV